MRQLPHQFADLAGNHRTRGAQVVNLNALRVGNDSGSADEMEEDAQGAASSESPRLPPDRAAWAGAKSAVVVGGAATLAIAALWSRLFPELRTIDRFPGHPSARDDAQLRAAAPQ